MYFREISGDAVNFGFPFGSDYTLAFSRILYPQEVLVAYNVSANQRNDCVVIDSTLHTDGDRLNYLYGGAGFVVAQTAPNKTAPNQTRYVQLNLAPHQFAILQ
jgi:alpha-amylase